MDFSHDGSCSIEELVIDELLAAGSYTVYVARSQSYQNRSAWALKVLHCTDSAGQEEALLHEAQMLLRAQGHHRIVRCHGLFSISSWPSDSCSARAVTLRQGLDFGPRQQHSACALLLDLHAGSLKDFVEENGRCCEALVASVVGDILQGLAHLHSRDMLHRNVTASNVLLTTSKRAVLADFALAVRASAQDICWKCGTPGYIAPEILLDGPGSPKIDIFATGVVLYFAASGQLPFQGREAVRGKADCSRDGPLSMTSPMRRLAAGLMKRQPEGRPSAEEALTRLFRIPMTPDQAFVPNVPCQSRQPMRLADAEIEGTISSSTSAAKSQALLATNMSTSERFRQGRLDYDGTLASPLGCSIKECRIEEEVGTGAQVSEHWPWAANPRRLRHWLSLKMRRLSSDTSRTLGSTSQMSSPWDMPPEAPRSGTSTGIVNVFKFFPCSAPRCHYVPATFSSIRVVPV